MERAQLGGYGPKRTKPVTLSHAQNRLDLLTLRAQEAGLLQNHQRPKQNGLISLM